MVKQKNREPNPEYRLLDSLMDEPGVYDNRFSSEKEYRKYMDDGWRTPKQICKGHFNMAKENLGKYTKPLLESGLIEKKILGPKLHLYRIKKRSLSALYRLLDLQENRFKNHIKKLLLKGDYDAIPKKHIEGGPYGYSSFFGKLPEDTQKKLMDWENIKWERTCQFIELQTQFHKNRSNLFKKGNK